MKRFLALAVLAMLLAPSAATAQEATATGAKKHEGDWYQVMHIDFVEGKMDEALTIIREHFAPAGAAVGSGPHMVLIHQTGEWDMTVIWELEGGPADLEWERSPQDVRWMQAMAERLGGTEAALAMLQRYTSLVDHSRSEIVRSWSPLPAPVAEEGG